MEQLTEHPTSAVILKGSKHTTRYVTISEDEYESMKMTIEFLKNRNLQKRLEESEKDYKEGRVKDLDEAMKELGVI